MFYQNQGRMAIPVYPVYPLLDCARRLFGMDLVRRFPPMPGAHIICANKNFTSDISVEPDPTCWVWAAIALAIAQDRNRDANLFIEDAGKYGTSSTPLPEVITFLDQTLRAVTKSMVLCGQDQRVLYREIFAGYVYHRVDVNQVGCSLTCAPYVLLAKNAIPPGGPAAQIIHLTISQWEKALNLPPLPPLERPREASEPPK
jgi:histidine decarboxylase